MTSTIRFLFLLLSLSLIGAEGFAGLCDGLEVLNVPKANTREIKVPGNGRGDSRLTNPILTKTNKLVMGSFDRNIYFYNVDGTLSNTVSADWYINDIYEFGDGTIAASSADGFVYFLTPDGKLKKKTSIGGNQTDGTIFKNDTLVISPVGGPDLKTVFFLNSSGDITNSLPYPGQLSAKPAEIKGLGLLLPSAEGSLLVQGIISHPTIFPLPGWQNDPVTLRNGNLANYSIMKPLTFVDPTGRVVSQEIRTNDKTMKGLVPLDQGQNVLGVYNTAEVGIWNQSGKRIAKRAPPHSEVQLGNGKTRVVDAETGQEITPLRISTGNAIVPIVEVEKILGPDPKDPTKKVVLASSRRITFYPINSHGHIVEGQKPFTLSAKGGITNPQALAIDDGHILVQYVDYKMVNGGSEPYNVAYVMDAHTFKPISRVESEFTLSEPVRVSAREFAFAERGPGGKVYFVTIE
jgi:hypothetical protein